LPFTYFNTQNESKMECHIPLNRQFSPIPRDKEEAEKNEILSVWGHVTPKTWYDLDSEFRCVILAEAGAGKTEEFRQHATEMFNSGNPAFFIRIEDIEADFYSAFEVGEEALFNGWLQSQKEAWFFLDSVDEARLENPRAFEKALRRFTSGIKKGAHRAHIYISSRPYAWRPVEDRRLLDDILFLPVKQQRENEENSQQDKPQSTLTIYTMRHLDSERIRRFCIARSAKEVEQLLREIERANLWSLAERPFDLEGILAKWSEDEALGGRLELLRHNIDARLKDDHSTDRSQRQPLNLEQARDGARRLSAAVVLSGQTGINVPDAVTIKAGIVAESALSDWEPQDVAALLERGIFNDIIYGAVRFRHRDVRELLAAEWFYGLLKSGNSRYSIEGLFFREQYGEKIITPRLRPLLPWLILFDDEIRRRALKINPEIAVEGGEPSRLPLSERKRILADIVRRIVSNEDDRSARDNSAIARIARSDLSGETRQLINEYISNDEAIFFLGRLVWQGEMTNCIEPLAGVALDSTRDIYARNVSARAVMTCGSVEQKQRFWKKLNRSEFQIPRQLLTEFIDEAEPNNHSINLLLDSLGKLPPFKRFEATGIGDSLFKFVERLAFDGAEQAIRQFLNGLHDYLVTPPYVQREECSVSEEYAWLLSTATHLIEKLVEVRSSATLEMTTLTILLMVPALRYWRESDFNDNTNNLQELVPDWPELNDALYWASIEQARSANAEKSKEPLIDDWSISWLGHFWSFDKDSLPRLIEYICTRVNLDDRLIALSTAVRVHIQLDKPRNILKTLQTAVADDQILQRRLDALLNPPALKPIRKYKEEDAEYKLKRKKEKEREEQSRNTWIAGIQANPDRISNPPNLKPGEFTNDQYWLMCELQNHSFERNRFGYTNWQALVASFGETVAHAYRDAAIKHWRHYLPGLCSEGAEPNKTPYSLIFAMAGLEMEATENPEFPYNLDKKVVCHALRYITWELNGFPSWLERMHQAFPELVKKAVAKELLWELRYTEPDKPNHYILHDLVYHAPWLSASIAPLILEWLETNPLPINTNRDYCLRILVNGETDSSKLAKLASMQIASTDDPDSISWWYSLRVDCDPQNGIAELENWLSGLNEETAIRASQIFITNLMGGRHMREGGPYLGHFRKAEHLKLLYKLMHQYIRAKDDINRANGGVYSPELRDEAQHARSRLFTLLTEIPGKQSYMLIKQLASEHPDPDYYPWMARQAYKRAESDGDLEPWSAEQVNAFNKSQTITPTTHRQLFNLTVHRLFDLKNWLERGNDSPWQTWQRAKEETEMRTLVAGFLNQQCREQYTTAQEPELANSQRMDIWLHNTNVRSPVPVELKLLDKDWSGPKLCERLRNQLVGDYLREESAGCGVMLLIGQRIKPKKYWMINKRRTELGELASALKLYWQSISYKFPGVESIEVIVIDLSERANISDS